MNEFLHKISLKHITCSSFITMPRREIFSKMILHQVTCFKSFSPFLFCNSIIGYNEITGCSFSKYLNNCIITTNLESEMTSIVRNSRFVSIVSDNGAALLIKSGSFYQVQDCVFINCQVSGNGGAIYVVSQNFNCTNCCFHLCNCGNSGKYGSSIIAQSNGAKKVSYSYCFMCPFSEPYPWHDQILLLNGDCYTNNVNTSHNHFLWNAGIDHQSYSMSTSKFIYSSSNIGNNAIGFYFAQNVGFHGYFVLTNNTAQYSVIYTADTFIKVSNSTFYKNTGPISVIHFGSAGVSIEYCSFDVQPTYGNGVTNTIGNTVNSPERTVVPITLLVSNVCEQTSECRVFTFRLIPRLSILATSFIPISLLW